MFEPSIEPPGLPASEVDQQFRRDVLEGLAARPRHIPARWFYDRRGSALFEAITQLDEYYPTRIERRILQSAAKDIAECVGAGRSVVEFGSGSSSKTPLLLNAIAPSAYVPIDISGVFLREAAEQLAMQFPDLPIRPVEADFTAQLHLPEEIRRRPRLGFFPGSTIGNLEPFEAVDLLRAMGSTLGPDAMLLIGVDRIKSPKVLIPAYDDAKGVTAAFNLNLLTRINRELEGFIPIEAFRHKVCWRPKEARIEMHLQAMRDVAFKVDGRLFAMRAGETIHTENSHKYDARGAALLLRAGGWRAIRTWTDLKRRFSVILALNAMGSGSFLAAEP